MERSLTAMSDVSALDVVSYLTNLDKKYRKKLEKLDIDDPFEMSPDKFTDLEECSVDDLPDFSYHDLYNFLVTSSTLYTGQSLKRYKNLDAYKLYIVGCVVDTALHRVNTSLFLFVAHVNSPDQPRTSHKPWVAVDATGIVLEGHCSCLEGGEVCTHVALLLFTLDATINSRKEASLSDSCLPHPSKLSGTSQGILGSDIDFMEGRFEATEQSNCKVIFPPPTPQECNALIEDLRATGVQCAVLTSVISPHA